MTEIDGLDIHSLHVKSPHENALPVIMIHGWPGSVVEMLKVVGPLTDPTAHGGSAVAQLAAAATAGPPGRVVPLGFAERGGVVSHTQEAAQCGRRARIAKAHPIARPDGEAEIEALDDRARRW
jgi:hypothetical protein